MESQDRLLDEMFSALDIWEGAIDGGLAKRIRPGILEKLSDPVHRESLRARIAAHDYHIRPPREARIPKDDGTMRTVYANDGYDRVILTVINNLLFRLCPEMIHPKCVSYQAGIGCGKIDRKVSREIAALSEDLKNGCFGYKIDLSKYFDSVPVSYIDAAFDQIERKLGPSAVLDLLREYYHDDRLITLEGKIISKYTSLRQGCAVAAFLADCVLRDIDEAVSALGVTYYRYSDDILIIGENADEAFKVLSGMLDARSLALNPKKIERLEADKWFTFLGFSLKGENITFSKKRVKNLQREIERRTVRAMNKKLSPESALRKVYMYLYDNSLTEYGYAEGVLPVVTSSADLRALDMFIMDCVRACATGRKKLGGLGYDKSGKSGVVTRGKGRNVRSNRLDMPVVKNYVTLGFMQALYRSDREAYAAYVKELLLA